MLKLLLYLMFLCCSIFGTDAQNAANFIIENYYKCENVPNPKFYFMFKPKTFSHPQTVDVDVSIPTALGNQFKMSAGLDQEYVLFNSKNWQHLFTFDEDFCRFVDMYLGLLAYDMEVAMGIPRGACPIPKGHYHAVNYTIDFRMMKLQTFPFGKLRLTLKILEKPSRNVTSCFVFIISNIK